MYICVCERKRETDRGREMETGAETEVSDECYFILFGRIKNRIKLKGHKQYQSCVIL